MCEGLTLESGAQHAAQAALGDLDLIVRTDVEFVASGRRSNVEDPFDHRETGYRIGLQLAAFDGFDRNPTVLGAGG